MNVGEVVGISDVDGGEGRGGDDGMMIAMMTGVSVMMVRVIPAGKDEEDGDKCVVHIRTT